MSEPTETMIPWTPPRPTSLLALLHYECATAMQQGFEPQNFLLGTGAIHKLDAEVAAMSPYLWTLPSGTTMQRNVGGVPVLESRSLGPFAVVLIRLAIGAHLIDPVWVRR